MANAYTGLSNRAKLWIIALSALVAIGNLAMAWVVAGRALDAVPMSQQDVQQIISLTADVTDPVIHANNMQLRTQAINTQVHLKGVTNKQSIIIVAIGSGFALMAIGFALFLIGADGAFTVNATSPQASLVITSTAPGLLCFVLAVLLIGYGVSRKYDINLGNSQYVSAIPGSVQPSRTQQPTTTIDP